MGSACSQHGCRFWRKRTSNTDESAVVTHCRTPCQTHSFSSVTLYSAGPLPIRVAALGFVPRNGAGVCVLFEWIRRSELVESGISHKLALAVRRCLCVWCQVRDRTSCPPCAGCDAAASETAIAVARGRGARPMIIIVSNRDRMPLSVRVEITRAPSSAAICPTMNGRLIANLPVRGYWVLVP